MGILTCHNLLKLIPVEAVFKTKAVTLLSSFIVLLFGFSVDLAAQTMPSDLSKNVSFPLPSTRLEGISGMGLIGPGSGWARVGTRLYLTANNGATWLDITPPSKATQIIYSPFFLDQFRAWVVLSDIAAPVFRIGRTEDGGLTWKSFAFDISQYTSLRDSTATPESMWFTDPSHGWCQWKIRTGSSSSQGRLFATVDGAETWTELPEPPSAGSYRFHTVNDGWMVGGSGSDELWSTHDGGRTWQQQSVSRPPTCKNCQPLYTVPRFEDSSNAAITIRFDDPLANGGGRKVHTTYVTRDSGDTWQLAEEVPQPSYLAPVSFASVVKMKTVRVFSDAGRQMHIRSSEKELKASFPKELPIRRGAVVDAVFATETYGWFVHQAPKCDKFRNPVTDGPGLPCLEGSLKNNLLSTTDGGKTFIVITPPSQ